MKNYRYSTLSKQSSFWKKRTSLFSDDHDDHEDFKPLLHNNKIDADTSHSSNGIDVSSNYNKGIILNMKKDGGVAQKQNSITPIRSDDEREKLLWKNNDDFSNHFTNYNSLLSLKGEKIASTRQYVSNAALQFMRQRAKQDRSDRRRKNDQGELFYNNIHSATSKSDSEQDNGIINNGIYCCCPLYFSCGCVQCVRTKEVGMKENCGEFQELIGPGIHCLFWPFARVIARHSLRLQQLNVIVSNCKTRDNVFFERIVLAIQYRVKDAYLAQYQTISIKSMTETLVKDAVRFSISQMDIDEILMDTSNTMADTVYDQISRSMELYGYEIIPLPLVTELTINPLVRSSMNEINTYQRLKIAMSHRAESIKVKRIKEAEAEVERSYLRGVGISKERAAIATGMRQVLIENEGKDNTSIDTYKRNTKSDVNKKEVMDILLYSQYMDVISNITKSNNEGNSMLLCSDPNQVTKLHRELSFSTTSNHLEREEIFKNEMKQEDIDMMLLEGIIDDLNKKCVRWKRKIPSTEDTFSFPLQNTN